MSPAIPATSWTPIQATWSVHPTTQLRYYTFAITPSPSLHATFANFRFYRGWYNTSRSRRVRQNSVDLSVPSGLWRRRGVTSGHSVVYLAKARYTGSYLKPGGKRPSDPIRFRNYVLRRLLEFHFQHYPLQSNQYDLILDRFEMTAEARENLLQYLAGNWVPAYSQTYNPRGVSIRRRLTVCSPHSQRIRGRSSGRICSN